MALKGSRSTLTRAMTARLVGFVALAVIFGASAAVAAPALGFQPHIVHVLTDDQDLTLRAGPPAAEFSIWPKEPAL